MCSADAQYSPRGKGHAHSELAAERNEVAASQRSTRKAFAEVMRSALVTHESTQHAKWSLMLLNSRSFAASMEKVATCCAALRNYDSGHCLSGYCLCLALAGTQYIPLLSDSHCNPLAVKVPIGCWACAARAHPACACSIAVSTVPSRREVARRHGHPCECGRPLRARRERGWRRI